MRPETLIAWTVAIVTVVGLVWAGIRAAKRTAQHPKAIEWVPDGVILHDAFSDVHLRWADISGLAVTRHTGGRFGAGGGRGFWALDVHAGKEVHLVIPDERCLASDLEAFVAKVEQESRAQNPAYTGLEGDLEVLLAEARAHATPSPEEQEELAAERAEELAERIAKREAELGRPLTDKEKLTLAIGG